MGGDIFTHRLLCLGCDACGLLIAMYSDRCFSVWSDSGELEGRSSANPDRDLDLLGEPSVTNIDVLIPGHGPGTLLLVFRTSFPFEKECEKPRALCPNNLAKKKGEQRPIFEFRFLLSFSLLDSRNYKMRYFKGPEAGSRPLGGLLEAQRTTCGSLLGAS